MVLDEMTNRWKNNIYPKRSLIVTLMNDILVTKLELMLALEKKGLRLCQIKTKRIECCFGTNSGGVLEFF